MLPMTKELIAHMWREYGEEVEQETPRFEALIEELRAHAVTVYPDIRRADDQKAAGTVDISDFKILYLLIRTYKPKVIFEIGTWVGTSAMIMAEAMRKNGNGGRIYTCDFNRYYALADSYADCITPINAYSDKALTMLPAGTRIDFVFTDGELTYPTITALKPLLSKEAVMSTHDYERPGEKGVRNIIRMMHAAKYDYNYYLPAQLPTEFGITSTIATLLPKQIAEAAGLTPQPYCKKVLYTYYLSVTANTYLLIRRVIRKVVKVLS
jgi:predicted O-methyltransferase YrrM